MRITLIVMVMLLVTILLIAGIHAPSIWLA